MSNKIMSLLINNYDKNHLINCTCHSCNKLLSKHSTGIMLLLPCMHVTHIKCYASNYRECSYCNTSIENTITEYELFALYKRSQDKIIHRYCMDIISFKRNIRYTPDYMTITKKIPDILELIDYLTNSVKDDNTLDEMFKTLLSLSNANITVNGINNLSKNKKVIVSNHSCYFDGFVINLISRCNFIGSTSQNDPLSKKIRNILPNKVLLIQRGKSDNTVMRMKKHIKEHGDMCVFSTANMNREGTISRFKTGAFHTGYPVQPVILRYNPPLHNDNVVTWLSSILSAKKIDITMTILPLEKGSFDKDRIERVRVKMAKEGNLALSRVSANDAKDTIRITEYNK